MIMIGQLTILPVVVLVNMSHIHMMLYQQTIEAEAVDLE